MTYDRPTELCSPSDFAPFRRHSVLTNTTTSTGTGTGSDRSSVPPSIPSPTSATHSNDTFLFLLYEALANPANAHALRWSDDGKNIIIDDKEACVEIFNGLKPRSWGSFSACRRQLNLWHFTQVQGGALGDSYKSAVGLVRESTAADLKNVARQVSRRSRNTAKRDRDNRELPIYGAPTTRSGPSSPSLSAAASTSPRSSVAFRRPAAAPWIHSGIRSPTMSSPILSHHAPSMFQIPTHSSRFESDHAPTWLRPRTDLATQSSLSSPAFPSPDFPSSSVHPFRFNDGAAAFQFLRRASLGEQVPPAPPRPPATAPALSSTPLTSVPMFASSFISEPPLSWSSQLSVDSLNSSLKTYDPEKIRDAVRFGNLPYHHQNLPAAIPVALRSTQRDEDQTLTEALGKMNPSFLSPQQSMFTFPDLPTAATPASLQFDFSLQMQSFLNTGNSFKNSLLPSAMPADSQLHSPQPSYLDYATVAGIHSATQMHSSNDISDGDIECVPVVHQSPTKSATWPLTIDDALAKDSPQTFSLDAIPILTSSPTSDVHPAGPSRVTTPDHLRRQRSLDTHDLHASSFSPDPLSLKAFRQNHSNQSALMKTLSEPVPSLQQLEFTFNTNDRRYIRRSSHAFGDADNPRSSA